MASGRTHASRHANRGGEVVNTVRLFCGYDEREKIGFHTFLSSVIRRSSAMVQATVLDSVGMRQGSNSFTLSRFLVPYLCGFSGRAIFADASDMLCLGDIAELDAMFDPAYAVQVVKHPDYESKHSRKYVGTNMECEQTNYSRKNWASVMLINCEHRAWSTMTPEVVAGYSRLALLQFQFLLDSEIGELPAKWNVLVDEGQVNDNPRVIHFSNGIPAFPHYRNVRNSKDWFNELADLKGE